MFRYGDSLARTYLVEWAKTKEHVTIAVGSAITYLSNAKTAALKKVPNNSMWQDSDSWYRNLRMALEKTMKKNKISAGEIVESKSPLIGRSLIADISVALISTNTTESYEKSLLLIRQRMYEAVTVGNTLDAVKKVLTQMEREGQPKNL